MFGLGSLNPFKQGSILGSGGLVDRGISKIPGTKSTANKLAIGLATDAAGLSLAAMNRDKNRRVATTRAWDAGSGQREMDRRNAIPLMVDDAAIEAARKRAMLNQAKRSGRESTMLTDNNSGVLGG